MTFPSSQKLLPMPSSQMSLLLLVVVLLIQTANSFSLGLGDNGGANYVGDVGRPTRVAAESRRIGRSFIDDPMDDADPNDGSRTEQYTSASRRSILRSLLTGPVVAPAAGFLFALPIPTPASADTQTDDEFRRVDKDFSYKLKLPPGFEPGNKPLKTHLDEINFATEALKGYKIGITVDPVRISSLRQVRSDLCCCCWWWFG